MTQTQTDNWNEIRDKSQAALSENVVAYINEICEKDPHPKSQLISVLHKVQEENGYLGTEQLDAVAQLMQIPSAKVSGVATFYHFFRLNPAGEFQINVCMGTACYVKGAKKVAERFQEELGIDFGDTTSDGQFSLSASRCLGTCGLAPVVMINDDVHPHVTPDQVTALLEKYSSKSR